MITYLAAPYTHDDPNVREDRFNKVNEALAYLIWQGYIVFSPISMCHKADIVLAEKNIVKDPKFWVDCDEDFMRCCRSCIVLTLDGWMESRGVAREIAFFHKNCVSIRLLSPQEVESWISRFPDKKEDKKPDTSDRFLGNSTVWFGNNTVWYKSKSEWKPGCVMGLGETGEVYLVKDAATGITVHVPLNEVRSVRPQN